MNTWHKSLALTAFILIAVALFLGADQDVPLERASSVVKVETANSIGTGVHLGNGFVLSAAHVTGASQEVDVKPMTARPLRAKFSGLMRLTTWR